MTGQARACTLVCMGRTLRVQTEGMYHVTDHAVAGTWLFLEEADYDTRIAQFAEAVRQRALRLHQFCLMGNHDHLLLSVEDGELSKVMQRLNRAYAGSFNREHRRRGRLFDGPYDSRSVVSERHLLELIRYIALNPEKDHFGRAEPYRYSSYAALVGLVEPLDFIDPEPLYAAVGGGENARRRIVELVEDGRLRRRAA
jgi:putative transposase